MIDAPEAVDASPAGGIAYALAEALRHERECFRAMNSGPDVITRMRWESSRELVKTLTELLERLM